MPHIKPFDYVMHTCGIWWINGSIICKSIHISVIPESNTGSIITQYWWHILFRPLVILLFNWILIFIKIFLWIITTALSRFSKKISNKQMCSVSKSKMDKMYTKKIIQNDLNNTLWIYFNRSVHNKLRKTSSAIF